MGKAEFLKQVRDLYRLLGGQSYRETSHMAIHLDHMLTDAIKAGIITEDERQEFYDRL